MKQDDMAQTETVNILHANQSAATYPQMTQIKSERVQAQTFVDNQGRLLTLMTKEQKQVIQFVVPGTPVNVFKDEMVKTE